MSEADTVLLADDDETIRAMVARYLRRLGLNVLVAGDGVEALECFYANAAKVDLVIMDLSMPRMEGSLALAAILDAAPELPAILMTGYQVPTDACRALIQRGVRFVGKPVIAPELAHIVHEMIARSKGAPRAGEP